MKKIKLDIQKFVTPDGVTMKKNYDLHGHTRSIDVSIRCAEIISTVLLVKNNLTGKEYSPEKNVTEEWEIFNEAGFGLASKTFYSNFSWDIKINTYSGTSYTFTITDNTFPSESSFYGFYINDDVKIGKTDVKLSELMDTVNDLKDQIKNSTKIVSHCRMNNLSLSASTFTKGTFTTFTLLNSNYLTLSEGILTIAQEGYYNITWNVRLPDTSTSTDINCGVSIDGEVIDSGIRGAWQQYTKRLTATGSISLWLNEGQTIQPLLWSAVATTVTDTGAYFFITYLNSKGGV